ncbi:hypothetical protein BB987_09415 [Photorhabdus temperata]|uniref:Mu-like prophage DNA circulation protein n=1 Tax=Photorhabdus khanii NC19 TaxID=1004151 RepID=W3V7W0_9GAMM|nr:DNA circularization N-terminal domain-containing protein [Photorhabdus khanii]ETS31119.1 Mu-like prophage DNA circulation protein [Photorhabdus khanii NC19]OHV54925.1 hypothetical protein BB987_09415 [Photorhabdus temperata]
MPLIKDAISSFLGKDEAWKWSEHLHPASFRGVPFAVVSGESVFGRRQASSFKLTRQRLDTDHQPIPK